MEGYQEMCGTSEFYITFWIRQVVLGIVSRLVHPGRLSVGFLSFIGS